MTAEDFLRSIRSFTRSVDVLKGREDRLDTALNEFEEGLVAFADKGAPATPPLFAEQIDALQKGIRRSVARWIDDRQKGEPVRDLSRQLQDRPIIFVFGKANSGKTTFTNFLIDELRQVGAEASGFFVMDGERKPAEVPFKTKITENTSRIQGVEIDRCLAVIDSPGLHSVTGSNEKLTRLYTDSADAILWLSSSSSPGQVCELHDLSGELERGKPLQPILTRSDVVDWEDGSGERRNKTAQTRRAQEDDVVERVQQLGLAKEIRPAVSISIKVFQESHRTEVDWENTGLATLFEKLTVIVDDARRYKVEEKATQVLRNFINDKVLGELDDKIKPMISDLVTESRSRIVHLNRKKPQISNDVTSRVMVAFEEIVEKHRSEENVEATLARELEQVMVDRLEAVVQDELTGYASYLEKKLESVEDLVSVSANELGKFKKVTAEVEQEKGAVVREVVGKFFPLLAIVRIIHPLVAGAVILLIELLFVRKKTVSVTVGISTAALMENAERLVPVMVDRVLAPLFDDLFEVHRSAIRYAEAVLSEIEGFKKEIA